MTSLTRTMEVRAVSPMEEPAKPAVLAWSGPKAPKAPETSLGKDPA